MNVTDITPLLEPVLAALDLEIDRVEVASAGKRSAVRIFLDGEGPAGRGPSLDQIDAATRAISETLDADDISRGHPYTLEVSSRGVTRPLTDAKHFRRNRGRLVVITVAETEFSGRIVGVSDDGVELTVGTDVRVVPLADIAKAVVQIEMNRSLSASDDEEEEA